MIKTIALAGAGGAAVFGNIVLPSPIAAKFGADPGGALGKLIQMVIWLLIIGAGIYALLNFVLAGYAFMSSEGDPKKIAGAWEKIWQTALGLAIAAGAFTLAAIFGKLIFNNASFILTPTIPTI